MPNQNDTLRLPLLVARSLVVFPGINEEIAASRPQSAKAIELSTMETSNLMFLVSQKDPNVNEITPENLYTSGTLVRIVNVKDLAEGGFRIRVIGSKRVRFLSFSEDNGSFFAVRIPRIGFRAQLQKRAVGFGLF